MKILNNLKNIIMGDDVKISSPLIKSNMALGLATSEGFRKGLEDSKDIRYNEPKGKHKASEEQIDKAIEETEIYTRAKELILNAQREQIGYGLDKYPETLNADTWSILETMHHIIGEGVDKLHYQIMLCIKLERLLSKDANEEFEKTSHILNDDIERMLSEAKDKPKSVNDIRKEMKFDPLKSEKTTLHADGKDYVINKEPEPESDCHIKIGNEYYSAKFMGIFQYQDVIGESPMIGGHRGGVVAYPVAVVRHGAILKHVKLHDIKFKEEIV